MISDGVSVDSVTSERSATFKLSIEASRDTFSIIPDMTSTSFEIFSTSSTTLNRVQDLLFDKYIYFLLADEFLLGLKEIILDPDLKYFC